MLFSLLGGCFSNSNLPGETGTVQGVVTYHNEPVPTGSTVVMVHCERGILAAGTTSQSGEFSVKMRNESGILAGEYVVHVLPPGELDETHGKPAMDNVPEDWKKIPMKYWTQTTSPATFVVQSGENTYNLVLED